MKETGFIINLLGKLDERKIQRQVNKVIKRIEKTINMLQITATLAKGDTKKNLNDYIKWIQSQLNHVELTTELGSKNQKGEADKALNIDVLNIDGDKTKQKAQKAIADAKAEEEGKPISIGINYDARRSKLEKEFTDYRNKNTKIEESSKLEKEADKVRELIGAVNDNKSLKEAIDAFQRFNSTVSSLGYNTKSTSDKIKGMFSHVAKIADVLGLASMAAESFVQAVITGIVTAYDNWIHRVEKANDAMDEAVSEFGSARSSLESIDSELAEHKSRMDELLSKNKLSYAEKGQLEELQAITKELMLQQDIERRHVDKASKETAEKAIDAYEMQYGKYGKTREELKDKLSGENFPIPESEDDVLGNIAAYVRAKELLEKSQKEYQDVMHAGGDTRWAEEDIQRNTDTIEEISQVLGGNISDLQEKRLALEAEYGKAVEKRQTGIGMLTCYEQDVISAYESIYDMIKMVYEYTSQNEWNNIEITDILNTKGIEKTKEELIAMSKAGELTPESITGFTNLYRAIQKSELILQDGQEAEEAFCDWIQACAEAEKDMGGGLSDIVSITPTISSSIQQLSNQLEPQFGKLGEAYQAIFTDDGFTLDNVDNSMLENLRQSFAEEVGVAFDAEKLDPFFDAITDKSGSAEEQARRVHDAFNDLATAYFYSTDTLEQLNDETAEAIEKQLEEMGVQNAAEVVAEALAAKTEELAVAKEFLADRGYELSAASINEANAFILEQMEAGNCGEALALLQLKKMLANDTLLDTNTDINNVLSLAKAAGIAVDSLGILAKLKAEYDSAMASGNYFAAAALGGQMAIYRAQIESEIADFNPVGIDFSKVGGGASSAKSAGKDAGKSYKDGLKEELSGLDSVISGVTGKIDGQIDVIKAQKEAALESIDAQIDALEEQKSLLEEQKKALEEARDAAVEALEDERDARIEAIEAQKEQLEEQIKLIELQIKDKEKAIKSIQDEIDAMEDANEQRKRQIDLQKAQYELERLQHQRTILQYSEEKGMHYVADTKGIRDQKDKVDDAKLEIEIANKQKQIDLIEREIGLLNEKKDAISEQITLLDGEIDKVNEFYDAEIEKTKELYDNQIKAIDTQIEAIDRQIESIRKQREETELYYEALIENLENSKSKYQELTEILGQAELSAKLNQLGIDEEALINGSEEEFEKLKNAYMDVVFKLNEGNAEVLSNLQALSGYEGTAPAVLTDSNTKLDEMDSKLAGVGQSVGSINSSLGEIAASTGGVASNIGAISGSLSQIPDSQKIEDLSGAFDILAGSIGKVAGALGISGDSPVSAIIQALSNLNSVTLGGESEGIIGQFTSLKTAIIDVIDTIGLSGADSVNSLMQAIAGLDGKNIISQFDNLKTAVEGVASAISGGGSTSPGKGGGPSTSLSPSMSDGADEGSGGGGNSITDAINDMGDVAKKVIGVPGAEGDGTAIGEFGSMKTAVNEVSSAIGSSPENGEKGDGGEGEGSLTGSLVDLGEKTTDILGESGGTGVIGKFEQFKQPIQEAQNHVKGIYEGLEDIDNEEVECTIKVNIETTGEPPKFAAGTLGDMKLESGEYNAKYGRAFSEGTGKYKGLPKDEGNALVSEYGQAEMTVLPDGNTIITDTPAMMGLPEDTVIFNEGQTKKILDDKIDAKGMKRHPNGVVQYADGSVKRPDGSVLAPVSLGGFIQGVKKGFPASGRDAQPGEMGAQDSSLKNKYTEEPMMDALRQIVNPVHIVAENMKDMADATWQMGDMNNASSTNKRNVQQPATVQIGDINLVGVQDVDGLAYAIKTRLPGKMSQEYFKN